MAPGTICMDGRIERITNGKCEIEGIVVCGGMGGTFGVCVSGEVVDMGRVPDGTVCKDGTLGIKGDGDGDGGRGRRWLWLW